jgi:hypothetical protein
MPIALAFLFFPILPGVLPIKSLKLPQSRKLRSDAIIDANAMDPYWIDKDGRQSTIG